MEEEVERLQERLDYMKAVLDDAEAKSITDRVAKKWLVDLKAAMYDTDDLIDDLLLAQNKICRWPSAARDDHRVSNWRELFSCANSCSCITSLWIRLNAAGRIKSLNQRLQNISKDRVLLCLQSCDNGENNLKEAGRADNRQTSPLVEFDVVGKEIQQSATQMVEMIAGSEQRPSEECCVFGITGMGGIGKTTLAQMIYNDSKVRDAFQVRLWICVSQFCSEVELLKKMIAAAGGSRHSMTQVKAELQRALFDVIACKSVFLVLDDVWDDCILVSLLQMPFENTGLRLKILITTRDEKVVLRATKYPRMIHRMKKMNDDDGWALLRRRAFRSQADMVGLDDIGKQILSKCDGLPLAIKVVAGMLLTKNDRAGWERVLDQDWSGGGLPEKLSAPLYLSYKDLSPALKQCFLSLALFPEDYVLFRDTLIGLWVAHGFVHRKTSMEDVAEEYYFELIERNLLQPIAGFHDRSRCKIHDLLRSLAQHLSKEETIFLNTGNETLASTIPIRHFSIADMQGERLLLPVSLERQRILRTLLLFKAPALNKIDVGLFKQLTSLRVLSIQESRIEHLPDSIGQLVHLRYLSLVRTRIRELPKSIGRLVNLQLLRLVSCHQFRHLPESAMRLSNIRNIHIERAMMSRVPRGIGRLEHLNHISGVFASNDGFGLEELQPLANLRHLSLIKIDQAHAPSRRVLQDKQRLKELWLACVNTIDNGDATCTMVKKQGIEAVYEGLAPPPVLRYLFLIGYPGVTLPEWLAGRRRDIQDYLPNIYQMNLDHFYYCTQVPPLGQLPTLNVLNLRSWWEVVSLGDELLGQGVNVAGSDQLVAFPKLELLQLVDLPNLVSLFPTISGDDRHHQLTAAFPSLVTLEARQLPRVTNLNETMKRSMGNLRRVYIIGAHELQVIEGIPLLEWLKVKGNDRLRSIANLPKLKCLVAVLCPQFDTMHDLMSLRRVCLSGCPMEQQLCHCLLGMSVMVHVASPPEGNDDPFPDEVP